MQKPGLSGRAERPAALRPYAFHGVALEYAAGAKQATGDCPFCGRAGKLTIEAATGLWKCWVCAAGNSRGGGNLLTFLRLLWDRSDAATNGASKRWRPSAGSYSPRP